MHRIGVLGAGLVGKSIVCDLSQERQFQLRVADVNPHHLSILEDLSNITIIQTDLNTEKGFNQAIKDCELVVNALPGWLGFRTLKKLIQQGKQVVDISFFPEDPFSLHELALKKGVTAIIDAGVAPGLSNIILGHLYNLLDRVESFLCYVGGLPVVRTYPFQYKAPFSPVDVLEEYTRPARFVENGRIKTLSALSEPELIEFPGIGTLEAFNTDGLRTLLKTLKIPFMKEKTLRYPGHRQIIKLLKDLGFFSTNPVKIDEVSIRPLDFTARIILPHWQFHPGEEDITVMRIIVIGEIGGEKQRYTYEIFDRYDPITGTSSMARTTGYTATLITRLLINDKIKLRGIVPPEKLGQDEEAYNFIISGLKQRRVHIQTNIEKLN